MDPRHIPIRSFTVYQTSEGWFWNWPGLNRAVGPYSTLQETFADLQHVMGVTPEAAVTRPDGGRTTVWPTGTGNTPQAIEFWRFQNGWSVVINGKVTQGVHFFETFARVKALCFRLGLLTPKFPEPLDRAALTSTESNPTENTEDGA